MNERQLEGLGDRLSEERLAGAGLTTHEERSFEQVSDELRRLHV